MKQLWNSFVQKIEYYIPMSFGGLLTFLLVLYLFYVVGRSIWTNYNSNKDLEVQTYQIAMLEQEITQMQNEINYYQTSSFKEKQAREKLAYKSPGENVLVLPIDREEDKVADQGYGEVEIKTPNYLNWWRFYSER